MKGIKGILLVLILAPLLVWGLNRLFFPKNDGEKYTDEYINNSMDIELDVPPGGSKGILKKEFKTMTVYMGIQTAFSRGKLSGKRVRRMIFYDQGYKKYFVLSIINQGIALQFDTHYKLASGTSIKARVSRYDLDSPDYGTKENPIPVFMLDIPRYADHPSYQEARISEEQYRSTVAFYLSYMISKKEFKDRFKNR